MLLWRDNIVEFSVRVAPSSDTIYRIVKHFEETEVCLIIVRRDVNVAHLFVRNKFLSAAREAIIRSTRKKCATVIITDWGLNQHYMKTLS